jgi:pantetheine-phosphate adenylyltransferase
MVVFASGMELWGSSTGSGVGEDAIRSVLASVVGPEGFGRGLADALLREGAAAGVVSADLIESESEKPASAEPGGSPASASSAAAEATSRGSMPVMPDAVSLDSMPAALVGSVAHVVIGGTFDRLHAGHWKLISAAALLAREKLTIGVTSDVMVSAKKGADQIAPQSKRAAMAQAVAEACAPGIRVECPIIEDPMGPSVTDASMGAIVVSSETAAGAGIINRARWEAGLGLLLPYSVHRGTAAGLSSTALREQDAKAT